MDAVFLKNKVFDTVGFKYEGSIEIIEYDGVFAQLKNGLAKVGGGSVTELLRAYFIFAKSVSQGLEEFEIVQEKHFKDCGVMIDMSRNGVMKPEAVKKYIDILATLGMNYLMLYTEDTYTIEGRPYFGYLRGRYTEAELKDIESYAEKLGVEIIPCIQTLAHMSQFLKWARETWDIQDTEDILMADEEKTYEFIEEEISTCRKCFKSSRIHIGMDEAWMFGYGRYREKNGVTDDIFGLLKRHLARVIEICKKYDFEPMMWSDMFFRAMSAENNYYDTNITFTEKDVEDIPDVGLVYWDYGHDDENVIKTMIKNHKTIGDKVIFAGSIGNNFLVAGERSVHFSSSALKVCAETGIENVMATIWGDDGNETNVFLTVPFLPVYSEYCYRGTDCSMEDIRSASEFITGVDYDDCLAASQMLVNCEGEAVRGKGLIYGDILYELGPDKKHCQKLFDTFTKNAEIMKQCEEKYRDKKKWFRYLYLVYKISAQKAELRLELQKNYKEGNRKYMKETAEKALPSLKEKYLELAKLHREQWYETYKPFGFEVMCFRYGGITARIDDVIRTVKDWLEGKINSIEELDAKHLDTYRIGERAMYFISPSNII